MSVPAVNNSTMVTTTEVVNTKSEVAQTQQEEALIETKATQATEEVNNDKTVGAKTSESRKKIPINIAVNPVLPPSSIPVALSTYAFNVDVPKTAPMSPLIASARKARPIPSALPSSSMKPH